MNRRGRRFASCKKIYKFAFFTLLEEEEADALVDQWRALVPAVIRYVAGKTYRLSVDRKEQQCVVVFRQQTTARHAAAMLQTACLPLEDAHEFVVRRAFGWETAWTIGEAPKLARRSAPTLLYRLNLMETVLRETKRYWLMLHAPVSPLTREDPRPLKSDFRTYTIPGILTEVLRTKAVLIYGPPWIDKTMYALDHFRAPVVVRENADWAHYSPSTDGLLFELDFARLNGIDYLKLVDTDSTHVVRGAQVGHHLLLRRHLPRFLLASTLRQLLPLYTQEEVLDAILRRVVIYEVQEEIISPERSASTAASPTTAATTPPGSPSPVYITSRAAGSSTQRTPNDTATSGLRSATTIPAQEDQVVPSIDPYEPILRRLTIQEVKQHMQPYLI